MISFIIGVVIGAAAVVICLLLFLFEPWGPVAPPTPPIQQFPHIQIHEGIRQFLKSSEDEQGLSKWESCHSLSLFLHMFYQEHKDTRHLRRWIHKRLQMELNDIATRSAAGRLLQEIRIRELSLGSNFPSVKAIRVENVEMSEDGNIFEKVVFVVDIDYTGGFETSIDVTTMFGKQASISIKITKLAGLVRFILSRKPYSHWTMSFVSAPIFETDIGSQIQGHQLKRLIPLIKESIRRALQRKHVWPNYKIRYRPVFPNPLLQPSPPPSAFAHIKLEGGLEVTVLQCTRLHRDIAALRDGNRFEVYCTLTMDQRPFILNSLRTVAHSINVMLVFSRYDLKSTVGLTFVKDGGASSMSSSGLAIGPRPVQVADVNKDSLAEKAMFQPGDILVAINNVPIRSERQATRFLQQTTGDLMVLVDRGLDEKDIQMETKQETPLDDVSDEMLVGDVSTGDPDDAFVALGCVKRRQSSKDNGEDPQLVTKIDVAAEDYANNEDDPARDSLSVSLEPSLPSASSIAGETTDSFRSSLYSLDGLLDRHDMSTSTRSMVGGASPSVQRTESARVPSVLVSQSSIDIRRTRSESQLNMKDKVDTDRDDASIDTEKEVEESTPRSTDGYSAPMHSSISDAHLLNQRVLDSDKTDKDVTLTFGSHLTAASQGGSCSSLISSNASVQTAGTDVAEEEVCLGLYGDAGEADGGAASDSPPSRPLSRNCAGSTRRQRLQATIQAGKRKMFDFIPAAKRRTTPLASESIEVGADANDLEVVEPREGHNRSPVLGKRIPLETPVVDKSENRKHKSKKAIRSASGSTKSGKADSSPTGSTPTESSSTIRSRTTKSVMLAENVLWGQSLHFEMTNTDGGTASSAATSSSSPPGSSATTALKYLNVTVHARVSSTPSNSGTPTTVEPKKPILLGYTSLYIPQLIDDCRLTLSNCHREVFPLKPPSFVPADASSAESSSASDEFSRHAGFDRRLCYGDITLGFRYFPDGLPANAATNPGDQSVTGSGTESTDDVLLEDASESVSSAATSSHYHDWIGWNSKTAGSSSCAMCRGKIWLKSASCCRRCQVVCHSKCVGKASVGGGIICIPRVSDEEMDREEEKEEEGKPSATFTDPFHPLDLNTAFVDVGDEECPVTVIASAPQQAPPGTGCESELVSRRTRLKNKVSEKLSSWRRGGGKKTAVEGDGGGEQRGGAGVPDDAVSRHSQSTVDSLTLSLNNEETMVESAADSPLASIQDCLSDVLPKLEGSPFVHNLYFQPGNAYNETTINNAKQLGKQIFANLETEERKICINKQIDIIQEAIRLTKDGRLAAMKQPANSSSFEGLDERLQALAVLMLHYCAALQDCASQGRSSPSDSMKEDELEEPRPNSTEPGAVVAGAPSDGTTTVKHL